MGWLDKVCVFTVSINVLPKFAKFGIEVWSLTGTTKLSRSIHLKPFRKVVIILEAYLGPCQASMRE